LVLPSLLLLCPCWKSCGSETKILDLVSDPDPSCSWIRIRIRIRIRILIRISDLEPDPYPGFGS
jgi:hypothetical protein